MLQQKQIAELLKRPEFLNWQIEIETNSTIVPIKETLDKIIKLVRNTVKNEGFTLGDRLQIRKYGDKRRT